MENSKSFFDSTFIITSLSAIIGLGILGNSLYSSRNSKDLPERTSYAHFPSESKISISLEDYLNIRGKSYNHYNMLQIYDCSQIIPQETEMIVNYRKNDRIMPCNGIALIPFDKPKKPFLKP